jgi:site-specific DNA recombinase
MKKAAGYVRVSTPEQTEGESLQAQKTEIEYSCKANSWKLTKIYADEGAIEGCPGKISL